MSARPRSRPVLDINVPRGRAATELTASMIWGHHPHVRCQARSNQDVDRPRHKIGDPVTGSAQALAQDLSRRCRRPSARDPGANP